MGLCVQWSPLKIQLKLPLNARTDEVSNVSRDEEGLECPICWESLSTLLRMCLMCYGAVILFARIVCLGCNLLSWDSPAKISGFRSLSRVRGVSCFHLGLSTLAILSSLGKISSFSGWLRFWMVTGQATVLLVSDNHQSVLTPRCSMSLGNHSSSNNNLIARP